jgi:hypothetical protein
MNILNGHTMIAGMLSIVYEWNYHTMAWLILWFQLYIRFFEIQIIIKLNAQSTQLAN